MSSFWSVWVIVITVFTIGLVTWILFANRSIEDDEQQMTGHVYDGIEEYDNPLPAWWFNLFLATIVFSVIYLLLYPGLGNFKGLLGWTSVGQWEQSVEQAEAAFVDYAGDFLTIPAKELADTRQAVRMGQRIFRTYCSTCHGVDAKGTYAFPDLTNGIWQFGGSEQAVKHSIAEGRQGVMPAMGAVLGKDLDAMVEYVQIIASDEAKQHPMRERYEMLCAACHQKDGSGNQMLGAPNLRDGVWLYGGSRGEIRLSIDKGRHGVMPAHKNLLSDLRIHLVTAYIYSLQDSP